MNQRKSSGRPRIHKARKGVTRQAVSAAALRAERQSAGRCRCGQPAATKRLKNGQIKTLAQCQHCLDYERHRKSQV